MFIFMIETASVILLLLTEDMFDDNLGPPENEMDFIKLI